MARLIYSALMSIDGFIEDEDGNFDWAVPDEAQHQFINELMRPIGTHLYGRKMYETMAVWETDASLPGSSPAMRDFAEIWQAVEKVVYSRTLNEVWTSRTRLERELDVDSVQAMKTSEPLDIAIAGPDLAAGAIKAGIVDDYHFFVAPVATGAGKHALPPGVRLQLELKDEQRFSNGVVYLRYASVP
jgi:dihydrofolate reductase